MSEHTENAPLAIRRRWRVVDEAGAERTETEAVRCTCSLGWLFNKGHGPDPARCLIHGDPTNDEGAA